jgi:asparagine synthase (glutamine-hydrolysing)
MCGITGIWHRDGRPVDPRVLDRMTETLAHRGPDDHGTHIDGDLGIGHQRLSIIDLTSAGHQPMPNDDASLWITYNGEIYNYIELREELRSLGVVFRSNCDTEVLLKAYERWGESCVERLNGIWAFAIWDAHRQTLFCSRDRFGVKPFHYAQSGMDFIFGSEIKALLASGHVPAEPNDAVVHRYLTLNITHTDGQTFFKSVRELPAAHNLTVTRSGIQITRYWDLPSVDDVASERSDEEWIANYGHLLSDSTRLQMRSDVPVGCCLSGGLDSTSLVRLTADLSPLAMQTFTSYLNHASYDEREPVNEFSGQMGDAIESHLVSPDLDTWFDELPRVIWHHDEPHVGFTAPAQWEVMRLAHETGVKVLLDGQGADESLGGYNFFVESLVADMINSGDLTGAYRTLRQFEDRRGTGLVAGAGRSLRAGLRAWRSRDELYRLESTVARRHLPLSGEWIRQVGPAHVPTIYRGGSKLESEIATSLQITMLPALLTYEDRASMAFSIESRVPYLDHRLVELAFSLPRHLRVEGARTKVVLRRLMEGNLPSQIVDARLKKAFGTPYQLWFSDSLRESARDVLGDRRFRERSFVEGKRVDRWLRTWESGTQDRRTAYQVWNMVNLELWHRIFIDRSISP